MVGARGWVDVAGVVAEGGAWIAGVVVKVGGWGGVVGDSERLVVATLTRAAGVAVGCVNVVGVIVADFERAVGVMVGEMVGARVGLGVADVAGLFGGALTGVAGNFGKWVGAGADGLAMGEVAGWRLGGVVVGGCVAGDAGPPGAGVALAGADLMSFKHWLVAVGVAVIVGSLVRAVGLGLWWSAGGANSRPDGRIVAGKLGCCGGWGKVMGQA